MSALGQKQTCAVREGMSALPPNSDIKCNIMECPLRAKSGLPTTTAPLVLIKWANGAACMIFPAELRSWQSFCIGDAGRQTPCHIVARLLFENHMWRGPAH